MKNLIGFALVSFLVTTSVQAQTPGPLGPSCALKDKNVDLAVSRQEEGAWCWAAVAAMVMNLHGAGSEQCKLVEMVHQTRLDRHGVTTCCGNDKAGICKTWDGWPEWAFDIDNKFSYQPSKEAPWKILTWTAATEEICQDRPFISLIDFVNGDLHTVVVSGYQTTHGEAKLRVYDPQDEDHGYVPYDVFFDHSPNYEHIGDTFRILPNR